MHSLCGSIEFVALELTTKMFAWNIQVLKMKGELFLYLLEIFRLWHPKDQE